MLQIMHTYIYIYIYRIIQTNQKYFCHQYRHTYWPYHFYLDLHFGIHHHDNHHKPQHNVTHFFTWAICWAGIFDVGLHLQRTNFSRSSGAGGWSLKQIILVLFYYISVCSIRYPFDWIKKSATIKMWVIDPTGNSAWRTFFFR